MLIFLSVRDRILLGNFVDIKEEKQINERSYDLIPLQLERFNSTDNRSFINSFTETNRWQRSMTKEKRGGARKIDPPLNGK